MRAVSLSGGSVQVLDLPSPDVPEGWARVRVSLAGICGTDLSLLDGYKAFDRVVPGHEFVGVVTSAATAPELVRQRVVADINVTCGKCTACAAGRRTHCEERLVLGMQVRGAFAEELSVPVENLWRVPDSLTDEQAVFAEPVAAACRIPEQLGDVAGARVTVLGAGRLGLLCAQVLAHAGADVGVLTRPSTRLDVLAACGLRPAEHEQHEADIVVDATGSHRGLSAALELVRPGGTVVYKSTCPTGTVLRAPELVSIMVHEVTIVGSRCGPLDRALELLTAGAVNVAPLVDAMYPLESAPAAFEHAARRGALKVLLAPNPI